jgi:hypothetical protein
MLKLTRKKRSQRCSAISWQDFKSHFTMGELPLKSCQEMALHRSERFLRVSFCTFLIFVHLFDHIFGISTIDFIQKASSSNVQFLGTLEDLQCYLICKQETQKTFSLVTELSGKIIELSEQKCDSVSGNHAFIINLMIFSFFCRSLESLKQSLETVQMKCFSFKYI